MESLLRQALNSHNSPNPEIRSRIYKAARNALSKTAAKHRNLSPDFIKAHEQDLETLIQKIEQEFIYNSKTKSVPEINEDRTTVWPPEEKSPFPQVSIPKSFDPAFARQEKQVSINNESRLQPEPQFMQQHAREQKADYIRPRRKPAKYAMWLLMILIIAVVSWVAYNIANEILNPQQSGNSKSKISQNEQQGTANGIFVILDPKQPDGLVTAENGVAEILDNPLHPAIRIMSVRQTDNYNKQANPILLQLPPGILKDIAGKQAIVEILAKSGNEGAATFTVSCNFGELGECSRKRFRIGKQLKTVVFSIQISADYKEGQKASLAFNTDVTRQASLSGRGSKIDILYARIYINNNK